MKAAVLRITVMAVALLLAALHQFRGLSRDAPTVIEQVGKRDERTDSGSWVAGARHWVAATSQMRWRIYFAPDKSKALTGGVTLGYVTHGDGFGAEVFVGKAFSFF